MKIITRSLKLVVVALSFQSFSATAQYGTGDSGLGRFLSENPDLKTVDEKHVDVPYEKGKSIFRGRAEGVPKLDYCIVHKDQKVKIKRSSMKSYKHSTYSYLSSRLYNCDKPENKIINELPRKEFMLVLLYLDVEYKLSLERK